MPEIHLVCGYMGFGKTTLAKKLAAELPAVRLTHDEFMHNLFGRNLSEEQFRHYFIQVTNLMWKLCGEICKSGGNVVMDMGFWSKVDRAEAFAKAQTMADKVVFEVLQCDLEMARKRVLERTEADEDSLVVDEICFEKFLSRFESASVDEGYEMRFHKNSC